MIENPAVLLRKQAEEAFKIASGEGSLFELRLRLLAGVTKSKDEYKIDKLLSEIKKGIENQCQITSEELTLIENARTIRNKLLHCEFSTFRNRIKKVTSKGTGGAVTSIDINTGKMIKVSDTQTAIHKDIYGWLIECECSNDFTTATEIFNKAILLIEKLANENKECL